MDAICLFLWNDHLLVLQRREDDRKGNGGTICLPGGASEGQEDIQATVFREVAEECGLLIMTPVTLLGEMGGVAITGFRRDNKATRPPDVQISSEHQGYLWLRPGEPWALHLPTAGPVTSALLRAWVADWHWPVRDTPSFHHVPAFSCTVGTDVLAVESGEALATHDNTVRIRGNTGTVLYKGVKPITEVGTKVRRGQRVAKTIPLKGSALSRLVLHLEDEAEPYLLDALLAVAAIRNSA